MTLNVPTTEFKRKLAEYLGRVRFAKDRIVITHRGRPVAQLAPIEEEQPRLSQAKGWLDDDPFFSPMEGIVRDRAKHVPRSWGR